MKLLSLLLFTFTLIACGAPHPFERGEDSTFNPKTEDKDNGSELSFSKETFDSIITPILDAKCAMCHQAGAKGPRGGFDEAVRLSTLGKPEESPLYTRPQGQSHPNLLSADSLEAIAIANWINGN